MAEDAFDAWLHEMSPESFGDGAFISEVWRRWLRGVYDQEGPLDRDDVEARATADVRTAAEQGLSRLLDDVERLHASRPELVLMDHNGLRVAYRVGGGVSSEPPEGITTPSQSEAAVAVAEAVIDLLIQEPWRPKLVCRKHGLGLRPQLIDDSAIWLCGSGPHAVAEIGYLTPEAGG